MTPRRPSRLSVERLKNMNPLIRLYGLKFHHGENDLLHRTGRSDNGRLLVSERLSAKGFIVVHGVASASHAAAQLPVNLRKARLKSAMGSQPYMLSPGKQTGEGRHRMLRGHDLDALPTDGAPVVVQGGESPLHGEGEQFKSVCDAYYPTSMR